MNTENRSWLRWPFFTSGYSRISSLHLIVLFICLGIGILGYHYTANIPWLDALHNASMILSGMGPVVEINTVTGKWFSSVYALFSGVVFITNHRYYPWHPACTGCFTAFTWEKMNDQKAFFSCSFLTNTTLLRSAL